MVATCGRIESDGRVTVQLVWDPVEPIVGPAVSDHQVVKGWRFISPSGESQPVFEETVISGLGSIQVSGLAQGNTYIWQVDTVYPDGAITSSDEAGFITSSVVPPRPGEEGQGFKIPFILVAVAAGGVALYFISKAPAGERVAETELLLPP